MEDLHYPRITHMFWLYNVLWLLAFPGVLGYLVLRSLLSGKYRRNLRPRLGLGLKDRVKTINREVIWVHALSVGEVLSAVPLIHSLRDQFPEYEHLQFGPSPQDIISPSVL